MRAARAAKIPARRRKRGRQKGLTFLTGFRIIAKTFPIVNFATTAAGPGWGAALRGGIGRQMLLAT